MLEKNTLNASTVQDRSDDPNLYRWVLYRLSYVTLPDRSKKDDQVAWPNEHSVRLPFWVNGGFRPRRFEPWSSKTNDFKFDTCSFVARCSVLFGKDRDWLAQCQDIVTDWDIRSLCW